MSTNNLRCQTFFVGYANLFGAMISNQIHPRSLKSCTSFWLQRAQRDSHGADAADLAICLAVNAEYSQTKSVEIIIPFWNRVCALTAV